MNLLCLQQYKRQIRHLTKQSAIKMHCLKTKRSFEFIILPFVIGIATSGLIFQFYYLFPTLQVGSTCYLLETMTIGFYAMCFISYYHAITIKNKIPETLIPPRIKLQLKGNHPIYTEKKTCDKQNMKYKPHRTSHCHICQCVARMDHHCPYTNGCVGSNNLKAFILFNFYGGIFAIQFLLISLVFYFKFKNNQADLSELGIVFWMVLNFFAFLLSFSMNGLWIGNLVFACKNITQMDLLKGIFKLKDNNGNHPNPFDLGAFSNLNTIFSGDYWYFWWPSEIINENDHTQYPMKPPVSNSDIKDLPQNIQLELEDVVKKQIPKTVGQLQQKYQSSYQGVVFFYLGKQYSLTPKQVKDQLRKITQISSKEAQDEEEEMLEFQEVTTESLLQNNQKSEEQRQILGELYGDSFEDMNL